MSLVSIIITTKNEEKNIGNCLESIRRQTYSQNLLEVIVVDNNSLDKTKEIAQKYTDKVFNFGPERSAQRNYGIKMAKGKYVMYLDADMILSPTVIEKAVEKLSPVSNIQYPCLAGRQAVSNIPPVALYIPEVILGNSYWSRVRRFERSFYDGTVIDCVRFVRKDIFDKVGGFDLSMTGPEDWDFDKKVRKIGRVVLLNEYDFETIDKKILDIGYWILNEMGLKKLRDLTKESVIFHNEAEFNLKKYLKKKNYYAKSFSAYINKWGKDDPDIRKQFGFWYRYFGVFLEKGKWKKIMQYPSLIIGIFLLRFLVGLSFVFSRFK